jgi:hypothetical protein
MGEDVLVATIVVGVGVVVGVAASGVDVEVGKALALKPAV